MGKPRPNPVTSLRGVVSSGTGLRTDPGSDDLHPFLRSPGMLEKSACPGELSTLKNEPTPADSGGAEGEVYMTDCGVRIGLKRAPFWPSGLLLKD